jgi:hypothetical protein
MRFLILHKTDARWEAGETPSPELVARVGKMLGEMGKAGALLAGEGLRASSLGARVKVSGGTRTVTPGPFRGENELPAGFSIVQTASLEEAVEWASRQAAIFGEAEIDVRPVTEPWDIGMAPRPPDLTTQRFMALRKATAASEAGEPPSPEQRAGMARFVDDTTRAGVHLQTLTMKPSRRGRRYRKSAQGTRVTDGPFTESKELIAGYVMVKAASLEEAGRWASVYLDVVETQEVDLREVEDD